MRIFHVDFYFEFVWKFVVSDLIELALPLYAVVALPNW